MPPSGRDSPCQRAVSHVSVYAKDSILTPTVSAILRHFERRAVFLKELLQIIFNMQLLDYFINLYLRNIYIALA